MKKNANGAATSPKRYYGKRGQFLPELMVSMSVLIVGVFGIVTLFTRSLGLSRTVTNNYVATYLAGEGIEIVKGILDKNMLQENLWWADGFSNGEYELDITSTNLGSPIVSPQPLRLQIFSAPGVLEGGVYSYSGGDPTPFMRKVRIALIGANEIQVNSIVQWTTRSIPFEINAEDHFYNWQ